MDVRLFFVRAEFLKGYYLPITRVPDGIGATITILPIGKAFVIDLLHSHTHGDIGFVLLLLRLWYWSLTWRVTVGLPEFFQGIVHMYSHLSQQTSAHLPVGRLKSWTNSDQTIPDRICRSHGTGSMQPQSSFAQSQGQPAFEFSDPTRGYYSGFEHPIAMGINDITLPSSPVAMLPVWDFLSGIMQETPNGCYARNGLSAQPHLLPSDYNGRKATRGRRRSSLVIYELSVTVTPATSVTRRPS
ncbi:uncharacterized protein CLUP02_15151 [Colletotrichum lupini]|uniref:Uncharacterized protein n=1 Tax=Colletotrichum lupini TaxID=145971 RepID=A0A9Q8T6B8_9PEZI|nr:uncharacterized protein CLUP02_15151 [Colletotrichum lupini]UQC89620.1 hypothetical protein CLUP02_15151 [Colletotrichum lupini]